MRVEKHYELYCEGRRLMERGALRQAVPFLKESAQLMPHFKTYELIGECLLGINEINEAVLYLSAAAGLGRKQFRPRFLLARALIEAGDRQHAHDKLEEALSIKPDFKAAQDLLAQLREMA